MILLKAIRTTSSAYSWKAKMMITSWWWKTKTRTHTHRETRPFGRSGCFTLRQYDVSDRSDFVAFGEYVGSGELSGEVLTWGSLEKRKRNGHSVEVKPRCRSSSGRTEGSFGKTTPKSCTERRPLLGSGSSDPSTLWGRPQGVRKDKGGNKWFKDSRTTLLASYLRASILASESASRIPFLMLSTRTDVCLQTHKFGAEQTC